MSVPTDLQVLAASRQWVEAYAAHHLQHHETGIAHKVLAVIVLTPKSLEFLAMNDRQALKQAMEALFGSSWENYLDEDPIEITNAHREAVAEAIGGEVDDEAIEAAVEFYRGWETRVIVVSLGNLEKRFEAAGSRGVELADEIDSMRIVLAYRNCW